MAGNNALARESISKSGIPVVFFFRLDINYWCFPPYKRLFSFYNAVKIMAIVCASKSIGVAQNKNLRKPRSTFSSSRVDSKSFLLSSSSFLTSVSTTRRKFYNLLKIFKKPQDILAAFCFKYHLLFFALFDLCFRRGGVFGGGRCGGSGDTDHLVHGD